MSYTRKNLIEMGMRGDRKINTVSPGRGWGFPRPSDLSGARVGEVTRLGEYLIVVDTNSEGHLFAHVGEARGK